MYTKVQPNRGSVLHITLPKCYWPYENNTKIIATNPTKLMPKTTTHERKINRILIGKTMLLMLSYKYKGKLTKVTPL